MVEIIINGKPREAVEVPPSSGLSRIEVPAPGITQLNQIRVKKTLSDLPASTREMNIISAVCLYKMYGLSDSDISLALNAEQYQIENVVKSSAYQLMYEAVIKNIIDEDADEVRQIFAAGAKKAAKSIVELSKDEDKGIKLKASQDVLDRAGHRPQDTVLHKHEIENTMRIEYIDEDTKDIPQNLNGHMNGKDVQVKT